MHSPFRQSQHQSQQASSPERGSLPSGPEFFAHFRRAPDLSDLWLPASVLQTLADQQRSEELEEQMRVLAERAQEAEKSAAIDRNPVPNSGEGVSKVVTRRKGAAEVTIFESGSVLERLRAEEELPEKQRPQLLFRTLCEMRDKGPNRRLATITHTKLRRISALRARFPNFETFLDKVCMHLRLAMVGGPATINLPRILLVGTPGIGKTVVIRRLAEILGLPSRFISCAELTAGFVLSGTSPQWGNARHGVVAKTLLESDEANPLVILDEIDKIRRDDRWPADGPLYRLLEPATAKDFRDEFLDLDINASRILWLATANEVRTIPAPIVSRFDVVHAAEPTQEQMGAIADSVNEDLLKEYPAIRRAFCPALSDEVKHVLRKRAPRTLKNALFSGYARAVGRERNGRLFNLLAEDIPTEPLSGGRPIGFRP